MLYLYLVSIKTLGIKLRWQHGYTNGSSAFRSARRNGKASGPECVWMVRYGGSSKGCRKTERFCQAVLTGHLDAQDVDNCSVVSCTLEQGSIENVKVEV